ncbi:MAG: hypothetical protein ONB55_21880 [candidate division KSB1 bacterium]|nr:hypothetical protein [candidate division KSB1 bacterium]
MITVFLFVLSSAVFRAIEQISVFRESWSWLPKWITRKSGILNLDGYHIASALNIWSMFAAGYFFIIAGIPLWWVAGFWLVHGNLFSLFFHVVFMRPGCRENFLLDWWMEIRGLLGFGVPQGYVRQKDENI